LNRERVNGHHWSRFKRNSLFVKNCSLLFPC
jgi:hypothetical protein